DLFPPLTPRSEGLTFSHVVLRVFLSAPASPRQKHGLSGPGFAKLGLLLTAAAATSPGSPPRSRLSTSSAESRSSNSSPESVCRPAAFRTESVTAPTASPPHPPPPAPAPK